MKRFHLLITLVLFTFPAFSQTQLGPDIDGEAANDNSGASVSLSADGSIVAIGANWSGTNAGHVRVYRYNTDSAKWLQMGVDIDGEAVGDFSGTSISLSADGSMVAIGAVYNDGNGSNAGHVRVYRYNTDSAKWVQLGADIDGEAEDDYSGTSVSLSADGSMVAIGASHNGGNGAYSGHVRVHRYSTDSAKWVQLGADIDGEAEDDNSGTSVSMSADGSIVAIGAVYNNGGTGHVRMYRYSTDSAKWVQLGADIDGEAEDDASGNSVSLSADGSVVAIGAKRNGGNGSNAGHVRVYRYNTDSAKWLQMGADIDGENANDRSGTSVSLSADGNIVAIGAPYNDGNGSYAGHVRVYRYNRDSAKWLQMGVDIDGEAEGDFSGISVSLSADGGIVAIGANENDGNGTNAGHVRVYQMCQLYVISSQPSDQMASVGQDARFSVGTSYSAYQWQRDTGTGFQDLTDGGQFSGTTNDTLVVKSTQLDNDSNQFRCIVSTFNCSETSGVATLTIQKSNGVNNFSGNQSINFYPNPAGSELNIRASSNYISTTYSISNVVGVEVKTGTLISETTQINVEDLPAGSYIIRLLNQVTAPVKIIKL